jgi:type VI secretion system protein ImpA
MASPETLSSEKLLQPISDSEPAGPELKEDAAGSEVYYRISDARRAARDAEKALRAHKMLEDGEQNPASPPPPPDWRTVMELTSLAIAERSKDLWLAAWLIEALTRQHGFAGLRDGFRLTRELCERFWEGIHPRPDEEEGYLHTVAQLTGLNGDEAEGSLLAPILNIPITAGRASRPLTSADHRQALDIEKIADAEVRNRRIQKGAATLEMFAREAAATPPDWYATLLDDLEQCGEEFSRLNAVLDERCGQTPDGGSAAPPASQIRAVLEECRDLVRSLAGREVGGAPEAAAATTQGTDASGGDSAMPLTAGTGRIATRDDAFRTLKQVAEFFRRTEPHSPVSYLLEQAVRWGQMTLPELMTELISEEQIRQEVLRRVGIPPAPRRETE